MKLDLKNQKDKFNDNYLNIDNLRITNIWRNYKNINNLKNLTFIP